MGNTIHTTERPGPIFDAIDTDAAAKLSIDAALTTARIGVRLGADRVEVWKFAGDLANLSARWVASPEILQADEPHIVPRDWFPWDETATDPHDVLVTRDPEPFALTLSRQPRQDAGIELAALMPLRLFGGASGAVCVYWHDDAASWDGSLTEWLYTAGLDALDALGR